jgi:hypothetical protein
MNKPNIENIEKDEEKRFLRKKKRKQTKMKISGVKVKDLSRIIKTTKN